MAVRVSIWLAAMIVLLTGSAIAASPADRPGDAPVTTEPSLPSKSRSDSSNCADLHMGQSFNGDEVRGPLQSGCSQTGAKPD